MSGEIRPPDKQAHEKLLNLQGNINKFFAWETCCFTVLHSESPTWSDLKWLKVEIIKGSFLNFSLYRHRRMLNLLPVVLKLIRLFRKRNWALFDSLLVSTLGLQIGLIVAVLLLLGLGAALFTYFYRRRWGLLSFALFVSLSLSSVLGLHTDQIILTTSLYHDNSISV